MTVTPYATDSDKVFAARMGPSAVAKIAVTDNINIITSRFHSGQFCAYY